MLKSRTYHALLQPECPCTHIHPDTFTWPWILPRAKKCPPDTFNTSVRTGAALSNPESDAKIKTPPDRVVFLFWQRMRDSNCTE